MSDENLRQVRVLHFVSTGGVSTAMQQSLFMPLLTRMPRQKVKAQVVSLSPGFAPGPVLRQNGIPVHEVALSKRRFSWGALKELQNATRQFRPDVIQAWGHTAQLAALVIRSRCEWKPKVVWSVAETAPIDKKAGFIDKRKLKFAGSYSAKADRIVYASEAAASTHRRCGYPEVEPLVIPPGVDPTRFKPDLEARRKVRDQLGLGNQAFVIGMVAPFQPEYDHTTLLRAVAELVKTHPNVHVILAGHGVQKGNGPLMAIVGGGTLGTRTQLLGEWSDISSFYAACDVACSSATTDSARMSLVMAMLCGVPCVGTGMGAQGEVIGKFGIAIEAGSPVAFVRGLTRVMELPADRRAFMVQSARKHALNNFVSIRSMQKYLQVYYDVVGRQALAATDVPTPEIDASVPVVPPDLQASESGKAKAAALVRLHEITDPDSIEEQVPEVKVAFKALQKVETRPNLHAARKATEGDVLQIFESEAKRESDTSPMGERARGVAEDLGDLLTPEELQAAESGAQARAKPAKVEAPKVEKPKVEAVKPVAPKAVPATPKVEVAAKAPVQKIEAPKVEAKETEAPKVEAAPAEPKFDSTLPEISVMLTLEDTAQIQARASQPRETPVQLPMLPQESEAAPVAAASGLQLELMPDLDLEPPASRAASGV